MIAKSNCTSIEWVKVLAFLILATASTVVRAEESGSNIPPQAGKKDQSRETKRIDLGDGLVLKEYREFKNGEEAVLIKTYERNGATIMRQIFMPGENDMWALFRDGKEILSQQIDDQGRVVNLVVSRDDGSWHEIFERQDDGAVAPIGTARLQQVRKHTEFMRKNFTPFADAVKKGNKKEADERLDSMIEKIKAGEVNPVGETGDSAN